MTEPVPIKAASNAEDMGEGLLTTGGRTGALLSNIENKSVVVVVLGGDAVAVAVENTSNEVLVALLNEGEERLILVVEVFV